MYNVHLSNFMNSIFNGYQDDTKSCLIMQSRLIEMMTFQRIKNLAPNQSYVRF